MSVYRLTEVEELASVEECRYMADYIYRVVLNASFEANKLFLSLAGGRKTMSAEMQQAGTLFGCDAMLHVVDKNQPIEIRNEFRNFNFENPMPHQLAAYIMPLVTFRKIRPNPVLFQNPSLTPTDFPVDENGKTDDAFYFEINGRLAESANLFVNYNMHLTGESKGSNFRALYSLSPEVIEKLRNTSIEIEFVQRLPKAELHCHFGGILSPAEMTEVADSESEKIEMLRKKYPDLDSFLQEVSTIAKQKNLDALHSLVPEVKDLRNKLFPHIPEPFCVAGFLKCFAFEPDLLDDFIYGKFSNLQAIGIDEYEKLGDLQGSALMQSENAIRKACKILARKCEKDNIKYIEVRCSPEKYTRGGLSSKEVVEIMMREFAAAQRTFFNIIFIASRHGKMSEVFKHIELAEELLADENSDFASFFGGFDLAGAENVRSPKEFRDAFLPVMEKCLRLTIHAGETVDAENIWEAVYYLNADRIGHGLTLIEKLELMARMRDRKITIEMCPSSNDQIKGFKGDYPLGKYLDFGLKVTLNTDNPGISLTTLSNEFIVANRLMNTVLTQWDALQLIKNSFNGSFARFEKKRKIILDAEREIINIIGEFYK